MRRLFQSLRRGVLGASHLLILLSTGSGCASLTNPGAEGIPVRRVPVELLAYSRDVEQTIPVTALGQPAPSAYRLGVGDVLGVYVEGITGEEGHPLPVHVGSQVQNVRERRLPPSTGYPVTVQPDGTIVLPLIDPVRVLGLTVNEANQAIRDEYVRKDLFNPKLNKSIVSLIQPRTAKVLVFRQEAANFTLGPSGTISTAKRGTGDLVELPAYENDVLHALAATGGFPGLDAYNEIVIYRNCFADQAGAMVWMQQLQQGPPAPGTLPLHSLQVRNLGGHPPTPPAIMRRPLRLPPGAPLPFGPADVVLNSGDVVFIEARDREVFYTAGLLPSGAHVLPRDHDLDVIEAITQVGGPLFNGAFGGSNLSGAFIAEGIGNPSPTLLTVLRRTPGGGQVSIVVDLNRAIRDPRERILIQPQDVLILQEKPEESLARFFTQTFFNFNVLWTPFRSSTAIGVLDASLFNRTLNPRGSVDFNVR